MKKNFKDTLKSKGFYVTLGVGICALLAVGYTVNGMRSAEKRLSNLNNTKKELEKNNELSSNYETINNSKKPAENNQNKTKENIDNSIKDNEDVLNEFDAGVDDYEKGNNKTDNQDSKVNQNNKTNEKNIAKQENNKSNKNTDSNDNNKKADNDTVAVMGYDNIVKNLKFNQEIGLMWPVKGEILKEFSEDKLVYFQTLGQYKYNPAVFIKANEGTQVKSAYKGVITSIKKDDELGNTVEISIGDKYVLTYGQLKDITVAEGNVVEEGQVIGSVAKPTSYYTSEGSHLYFEVCDNNSNVNPLLFLR